MTSLCNRSNQKCRHFIFLNSGNPFGCQKRRSLAIIFERQRKHKSNIKVPFTLKSGRSFADDIDRKFRVTSQCLAGKRTWQQDKKLSLTAHLWQLLRVFSWKITTNRLGKTQIIFVRCIVRPWFGWLFSILSWRFSLVQIIKKNQGWVFKKKVFVSLKSLDRIKKWNRIYYKFTYSDRPPTFWFFLLPRLSRGSEGKWRWQLVWREWNTPTDSTSDVQSRSLRSQDRLRGTIPVCDLTIASFMWQKTNWGIKVSANLLLDCEIVKVEKIQQYVFIASLSNVESRMQSIGSPMYCFDVITIEHIASRSDVAL